MINAEKHIDFLELELEEISNKLIEKLNTSAKNLFTIMKCLFPYS